MSMQEWSVGSVKTERTAHRRVVYTKRCASVRRRESHSHSAQTHAGFSYATVSHDTVAYDNLARFHSALWQAIVRREMTAAS